MDASQLDLIQHVCERPGMHVVPGSLDGVFAYLTGMDTVTGCLTGFREWLLPRFDDGNNLSWTGVVKMLLDQENVAEDDAVARLGELIAEFYEFTHTHRAQRCDLTRVYLRYHAWLLDQSWYTEGRPDYIPPYDGVPVLRSSH